MTQANAIIRETIFQVLNDFATIPNYQITAKVLDEVATRLTIKGEAQERNLLTVWGDLFRFGVLSLGRDLSTPEAPYYHFTERGINALNGQSRDPANPDSYLAALKSSGLLSPITESYISEAVETYNYGCFKASAVMVGCASEALILELRDAVITRLSILGRSPFKELTDWRAKTVLDAVGKELTLHVKAMPVKLREAFQYHWPSFLQQIRAGRNDSGHPSSIDPITTDDVHASLIIFPLVLTLTEDLRQWISTSMP